MAVLPSGLTQSSAGFSDLFSNRAWSLAKVFRLVRSRANASAGHAWMTAIERGASSNAQGGARLLRWVLVRDPCNAFQGHAFLCTDLEARPEQILAWFINRWQSN